MERTTRILAGIISIILISGLVYFGVKVQAVGVLKPKYQINALFSSAGQGLQAQSDVKVNGVNIGHVRNVRLQDGRALVRMDIKKGQKVPVNARATIRPKTLFGEKFVDIAPGDAETTGPFLKDEDYIEDTLGGFELEKVLTELYPVLKAVKASELTTIVGTLADSADGEGAAINRQIANFAILADVSARHDADFRQFLDDLVKLSDELADRSGDLVGAARDLNVALPPINERSDELAAVLDQAGRLSTDVADLLEANQSLLDKANTKGLQPIQILYDRRALITPLVDGLRTFFQVLTEIGHIPVGDGTYYAGVKFIIGENCPEGRVNGCGPNSGSTNTSTTMAAASRRPLGPPALGIPGVDVPILEDAIGNPLPKPTRGAEAVDQLVGSLLR